jgi:ABC-2 type transport system permease protein
MALPADASGAQGHGDAVSQLDARLDVVVCQAADPVRHLFPGDGLHLRAARQRRELPAVHVLGAFGNATTAIVGNKALVRKIYLPRELFPVAAIINAFIHFLPQLAILLIVAILYGWRPGFGEIGAVLAGLVMIALIAFGLGLLFAGLNVRFRDAENFAEVIRQLATWASPVLYTWQLIPDKMGPIFGHIYMCNPITIAVEFMHYGFWAETVDRFSAANPGGWIGFPPHFSLYVLVAVVASILLLVIGQAVFRRFERTFAQDL